MAVFLKYRSAEEALAALNHINTEIVWKKERGFSSEDERLLLLSKQAFAQKEYNRLLAEESAINSAPVPVSTLPASTVPVNDVIGSRDVELVPQIMSASSPSTSPVNYTLLAVVVGIVGLVAWKFAR